MPIIIEPARRGAFIRCTTTRIAFRTHWNTSPILCARLNLKIIVHCTIGFWSRLPTLAGLRRRGFTPSSIRLFCERIGISKADAWIDIGVLEQALRDDLEPRAP